MKEWHVSKLAGVVAVLALLLTEATAAKKPTINTLQFTETFVDTELCSFDISFQVTMTLREFIFYDDSGNAIKAQVHARFDAVATNLETGKTIVEQDVWTNVVDLTTGKNTFLGLPFRLRLPNGRPIVMDVGKVVFDPDFNITFVAGPHPLAEALDLAQLYCPALE